MTTNDLAATNDAVLPEPDIRRARHFYSVRLLERDAWFGVTGAALLNSLGMLLEIAMIRSIPGASPRPAAISAIVALILLIVLFVRRRTPSIRLANILYVINAAAIMTAMVLTNLQFAVSVRNWVPFQASKLGCLIAAMVAPGFWVGLLTILAYTISALVQLEFFFPPELKARVAAAEPWPILAFGLAGVLALVYRFRRTQLEQEIARIQAQNSALKGLATAFLNIRDRMNTPLQVIEFSVDVLRNSKEPSKPILDRIDRAVQNLTEVNHVLIQHEKEIECRLNGSDAESHEPSNRDSSR